jgi:ABC-2 type transport system permease protein
MKLIQLKPIYILWLREMKIFLRAKSRIVGSLLTPLLFLAFLGSGLAGLRFPGLPSGVNYLQYLVPGMVGMTMIFSSMFAGISVLWDRQFGFLKEIMVTPVSRVSIVLGRIAGGATTSVIQGVAILILSLFLGFQISSAGGFLFTLIFMVLISMSFIGLGLAIASRLRDMQGFSLIMNFIMFPLLFVSGAFYPLENLPAFISWVGYVNPLTFGIDGMRGTLIGTSSLPLVVDMAFLVIFCAATILIGAYLFEKSESV